MSKFSADYLSKPQRNGIFFIRNISAVYLIEDVGEGLLEDVGGIITEPLLDDFAVGADQDEMGLVTEVVLPLGFLSRWVVDIEQNEFDVVAVYSF